MSASRLSAARRLVVKIGSALLVDESSGRVRRAWLESLADDIAALKSDGVQVMVVSSGAIALGRNMLGLPPGALRLEEKQAAAAAGQARLVHSWRAALARRGIAVAQILLTLSDTEIRRRHLNARNTIDALLKLGAVPVINENDTVATEEIRFGDNDRLAARVAQMTSADTLVLLSDIDGLYSADPRTASEAWLIPEVSRVTPEIEAMAGAAPPGYSSGGMVTKLAAAKIALAAGCRMVIAPGTARNPLAAIIAGGCCTWFDVGPDGGAAPGPRHARKRWIASSLAPAGRLAIDAGARRALGAGKSLLPAGVTAVDGEFERGDAVLVVDAGGETVARGLSAYSSRDAARIIGHKSREIEALLGYRGRDEIIHRDDLVLERAAGAMENDDGN